MKFFDIPQFTKYGSWQGDYDIVDFVKSIERMEKDDGLILNPDFQRGNIWIENQQIKFVEFILKGGNTSRIVYLNHPNWTYRHKNNPYKEFVCVDGLQRITAMKRFINNEIKVLGYYFNEYEDKPDFLNVMKININDLQTRKEVLQWYIEFNAGGTVHSDEEINKVRRLLEQER
jgi:hypothetical protein